MAYMLITVLVAVVAATAQALKPQTDTFNSTFKLSAAQIASLNLSAAAANDINIAAQFERSNWATGSVLADSFYTDLPPNASHAPAGSLLKVQLYVDTTNFTIAPTLALSRMVYQSKTLNDTLVPASAYILWPYLPRNGASRAPLVTWGHGTSGIFPECAPSHIRNLWYEFSAPYLLALAGYAVVGADFAGLGVPFYPDGSPIVHQYVASPAAGNDLLYAAEAATAAFPDKLTKEFAVMGHSQGGGAAWAAAQQQLKAKVPGYLGSIAVSPVTNTLTEIQLEGTSLGLIQAALGLRTVFPEVPLSAMLTPEGIKTVDLMEQVQGCNSVLTETLDGIFAMNPDAVLTRDSFLDTFYAARWANLSQAGGKDFEGPLMVIQGLDDETQPPALTAEYLNKTCQGFPNKNLHYVTVKGVDHVPTLYATQQIWLSWLDERFAAGSSYVNGAESTDSGAPSGKGGCSFQTVGSAAPRPLDDYQGNLNYFLEFALDAYEVA